MTDRQTEVVATGTANLPATSPTLSAVGPNLGPCPAERKRRVTTLAVVDTDCHCSIC